MSEAETGFFNPHTGYWQAIGGDPESLLQTYPEGTQIVPLKPDADYEWQNGAWVHVPPAVFDEPVPREISDRQFFQQLAVMQLITKEEAIQAVKTGDLPQVFVSYIATLPEDQRFGAEMALSGATTFERAHPLVAAFAAYIGMTDEQVDKIWRDGKKL